MAVASGGLVIQMMDFVTCLGPGAIRHVLRQASLQFLLAFEPLCCLSNIP